LLYTRVLCAKDGNQKRKEINFFVKIKTQFDQGPTSTQL